MKRAVIYCAGTTKRGAHPDRPDLIARFHHIGQGWEEYSHGSAQYRALSAAEQVDGPPHAGRPAEKVTRRLFADQPLPDDLSLAQFADAVRLDVIRTKYVMKCDQCGTDVQLGQEQLDARLDMLVPEETDDTPETRVALADLNAIVL